MPAPSKKQIRTHATVGQLLKKPARTKDVTLTVPDDADKPVELTITLRAIGSTTYDEIVSKHPPTAKQKKDDSATFNIDTFAPALMAACCIEPALTDDEAKELWASDQWSRGELMQLFLGCVEVNSSGLDVPFTASA